MAATVVASSALPVFNDHERGSLERLFRITLMYLAFLIAAGLLFSVYLLRQSPPQDLLLVAIATGVIGSATAAFVSVLDRHAQGLEDRNGGATPDPSAKKERFSERMFYWFIARPWLGAVVSVAVFWGMLSGHVGPETPSSTTIPGTKVAFYGLVAGLFAKSVLDILRNLPKNLFRQ